MLEHLRRFAHTVVIEHLRGQRYTRYRGLELMGHIVDEIILHLCQFLLPERHDYSIDRKDQQQDREEKRRNKELDGMINIVLLIREIDLYVIDPCPAVVGKQSLNKSVVLVGLLRIVTRSLVDHASHAVHYGEFKWQCYTIGRKLRLQQIGHYRRVSPLLNRQAAGLAYDIDHNLIEQRTLIDVLRAYSVSERHR